MQNINGIRRRIHSVAQTRKISNALYLISSARMKRALARMDYAALYYRSVLACVRDIQSKSGGVSHPYLTQRGGERKRSAYIVIAGDKGMCGAYNANVLKLALSRMRAQGGDESYLIAVGMVAAGFFRQNGIEPDIEFRQIAQNPSLFHVRALAGDILSLYDQNLMDEVHLVFTRFHSAAQQSAVSLRLLPLPGAQDQIARNIAYHPGAQEVFDTIAPQFVIGMLFDALQQAFASEQAARMTAMENATRNADEMLRKLRLQYNIARQSAITQELSEIISAAESLAKEF